MIEALNLLTEDEILKEGGTTLAGTEAVLILNGTTDIRGQIDVLVLEVEGRQEFLGVGSSITVCSALNAAINFTGHVRARGVGNANQAGNKS